MRSFRVLLLTLSTLLLPLLGMAQTAPQAARDYVYGPRGKLAVTIEPDNYPPNPPPSVTATVLGCTTVQVTWSAATDIGSGVAGYHVYRDYIFFGNTTGLSLRDNTVADDTTYTYEIRAYDAAGHEGEGTDTGVYVPFCGGWNRLPAGFPTGPAFFTCSLRPPPSDGSDEGAPWRRQTAFMRARHPKAQRVLLGGGGL